LDPIITVLRPVTAFFTALAAGIVENFTGRRVDQTGTACASGGCESGLCGENPSGEDQESDSPISFSRKLALGLRFAFDDLMADLATWFILGIFLAGLIATFVSDTFLTENLGSGILSYLTMMVVSLPMYVCATMTTPIAAALVVKGLSPGAALVLLIAGPATNMATLTVVAGMLGKRSLGIYLGSIVVCTILFAFLTDAVYAWLGMSAQASAGAAAGELFPPWVEWGTAVLLGVFVIRALWKKGPGNAVSRVLAIFRVSDESPSVKCCPEAGTPRCT